MVCVCQATAAAAAEGPEGLLLEHFPASETSAEASNEGGDAEAELAAVAATTKGRRRRDDEVGDEDGEMEEELADDMERARALAAAAEAAVAAAEAAARVVRLAALRRLSREERAAVRIQAYYRGYLVRRRSLLQCRFFWVRKYSDAIRLKVGVFFVTLMRLFVKCMRTGPFRHPFFFWFWSAFMSLMRCWSLCRKRRLGGRCARSRAWCGCRR